MFNFSGYKPVIVPISGTCAKAELDRVQSIDPTATLNREKVKEVGRDGTVGWLKKSPTIAYRLVQNEYASMEAFRKLANKLDAVHPINITDFKTSYSDILAYLVDDDGALQYTVQYPDLRVAGFSLNISDPDAKLERNFDLVGEKAILWQGNNKYFISLQETADSGEISAGNWTKVLTDPTPIVDPDVAGQYMLRVVRIRSGVTLELAMGTGANQYEYSNSTHTLTVHSAVLADTYKIQYTATTYITGQEYFVKNDTDAAGILPYYVSLYIGSGNYMYKLQSATVDVRFDRSDYKEIGNKNVVQRGITNKTVTVSLGRLLDSVSIEEVLRGQSSGYGKIDVEKYLSNIALVGKIFSDDTKTTFKWGFKITNLSPTEERKNVAVDEYTKADVTLESEELIMSDVSSDLE